MHLREIRAERCENSPLVLKEGDLNSSRPPLFPPMSAMKPGGLNSTERRQVEFGEKKNRPSLALRISGWDALLPSGANPYGFREVFFNKLLGDNVLQVLDV